MSLHSQSTPGRRSSSRPGSWPGRPLKEPNRELQNENERLKKLIGELTIANDSLKKALRRREEKMSAIKLMLGDEGMSLRKALRYSGVSSCSYYYRPVARTFEPDPRWCGRSRSSPSGDHRTARGGWPPSSRGSSHAPNRKRVQRIFHALNWIEPA